MSRTLIPNSTQIPDVILDHWMAKLSGAEFKVLLYIARRTYGFGKDTDDISLNQLAHGIRRRDGTRLDRGTGLSRSGVKAASNTLIAKGLVIRSANTARDGKEPEESTYRLNLYAPLPDEVGQKKAYVGQKGIRGRPKIGPGVGQKLALQETDIQETDQETAAARRTPNLPDQTWADAAVLVEELVAHGVSRTVAEQYAQEKPEVCRLCLEYLPYAKCRSSKGAWLANAIRHEYGPPAAYEQAMSKQARTLQRNASKTEKQAILRAQTARLRATLGRMEKTHPEAFVSFQAFSSSERQNTERLAARLSPERRADVLAAFDSEEQRLERFGRWLAAGYAKAFVTAQVRNFTPACSSSDAPIGTSLDSV